MSKKAGKEKHNLFNSWSHFRRSRTISEEWFKDFWLFVEEVGERPENCTLKRKDNTKPISKTNFFWRAKESSLKDYEDRNSYMRVYMQRNRHLQQNADLKKKYGITLKEYQQMQDKQNNVCLICGNPETIIDNRTQQPRRLAVDHCHTTGKIRGLLCMGCNQGLGNFKEDKERLQKAINYLTSSATCDSITTED